MLEMSDHVVPVHPAATVVLVRDGEQGLEALLVQRSKAVQHMGGMWVFPGGRIEKGDYAADGDADVAAANAAVRETHEEAGLLLDPHQLVYMSHWTTPEGAKKRFATWFFLAVLEDGQAVEVDGGEIADHRWVRPEVVLAELADAEHPMKLMPPTFVSLVDIAGCFDCAAARTHVEARPAWQYAPRMVFVQDGICFLYKEDAGYVDENLDADGARHRVYMIDGQLEYIRQL